jgi:hypothetical protein
VAAQVGTRFQGGIGVQQFCTYLSHQPIDQFLPFASSGLAQCRREIVDR